MMDLFYCIQYYDPKKRCAELCQDEGVLSDSLEHDCDLASVYLYFMVPGCDFHLVAIRKQGGRNRRKAGKAWGDESTVSTKGQDD